MRTYTTRTFSLLEQFLPACQWQLREEAIALTFDDGPHPTLTPWVLDQLEQADASATFFLIGDRVRRYPDIVEEILARGHQIGGHTSHHLDLWKTHDQHYLEDALETQNILNTPLFRPPYGHITRSMSRRLIESSEIDHIIMWSLLTGDFDTSLSPEKCFHRIQKNLKIRDIVVFHDSDKAEPRLSYALPAVLDLIHKNQWPTQTITRSS